MTAAPRRTPLSTRKTFSAKVEEVQRTWWIIDADNKVLGKVAVAAANLLRGKNKSIFTTHCDTGDHVVVVNAAKVKLTGKKETQKVYKSHSGYIGNQKIRTVQEVRAKHPERIVEKAIFGMIPHTRLGRKVYTKLRVYAGTEHPHEANQPQPVVLS
ncbi:MAG TPA: 50S ribosomal protein L13 [Verrucomicrobiaceae bacterium]|jgi:large subunit ribosomal protein L13